MQLRQILQHVILEKLRDLGSNFDVASDGEIEKLEKLKISGERMIYAQSC